MSVGTVQLGVLLLLVASATAQTYYCPVFGGTQITWDPTRSSTIEIITRPASSGAYPQNANCYFSIQATMPGRVIVRVQESNLNAYSGFISIRTDAISGYLSSWDTYTYNPDRDSSFISTKNQLYISFTSRSSPVGYATGVRLWLTFLPTYGCPAGWVAMNLDGQSKCVGSPGTSSFRFGSAQRYCNLHRSNLLVSERDSVFRVLQSVPVGNVWIGMTAEPSGSISDYRWINNIRVSSNVSASVTCTGTCRPGSTAHRCVYASQLRTLIQDSCDMQLRPVCYMPAGGTDVFYAGSSTIKASGALLAGAVLLFWSLLR